MSEAIGGCYVHWFEGSSEVQMRPIESRSWIVGATVAVVLGLSVAVYFAVVDWRFNPGGIFHDDSGTHWGLVFDTVFSWFLPVALIAFMLATILHYWLAPRGRHQ